MFKKRLSNTERGFWSAIGIGSGLTVFFFGVSLFPDEVWVFARGWITTIAGIIMLSAGLYLAFIYKSQQTKATKGETKDKIEANSSETVKQSPTDEQYDTYLLEERKSLLSALLEQAKSFDRWILTLAGGTFGLSLVFINQIAPNPKSGTITYLGIAWVSFAVSILLTLISFLFSQEACYKQVETVDKLLVKEIDRKKRLPLNVFGKVTKCLNWFSMLVFVAGVSFLIIFATVNLA